MGISFADKLQIVCHVCGVHGANAFAQAMLEESNAQKRKPVAYKSIRERRQRWFDGSGPNEEGKHILYPMLQRRAPNFLGEVSTLLETPATVPSFLNKCRVEYPEIKKFLSADAQMDWEFHVEPEIQRAPRESTEIVRYSTVLITALQEVIDYDIQRHHNRPPPALFVESPSYQDDLRSLVAELKRLNDLLESKTKPAVETNRVVSGLAKHFDKFLEKYAGAMGVAAAGLTTAAIVALLARTGVGNELIPSLWRHLKIGH